MKMETKENDDVQEDWSTPASPIVVLQKLSEEAVRRAGEALHGAYSGSPIFKTPPQLDPAPRHRRARSEVAASFHRPSSSSSTSSFQKWTCQMRKALHWNSSSFREGSQFPSFDPEILANQKRQWYQLQSKTLDREKYKEPTSLFEHFIVAGLRPDANLGVVEDAFIRRKKWEKARAEMLDLKTPPYQQPTLPKLEPQVLFKYPPGKKLALRLKDLAAFCFPEGVKAQVLEKTPSLSELNELVYGQEHLFRDDSSFIFSLKVADNATLYGVCLHVKEFVQKPHAISGVSSGLSLSHSGCNRFLVPAPRCYCFLTRVPFFELHFEILNSIISQDRLNRITQFVSEISFADHVPLQSVSKDHTNGNVDSPYDESDTDWMASAIPVNSATAVTAAAAGIISEEDVPSSGRELNFPTANDSLDNSRFRRLDKDDRTNMHYFDTCSSKAENQSNDIEQMYMTHVNSHTPDGRPIVYPRTQSLNHCSSFEALFSSAKSMASEVDDDGTLSDVNDDPSDDTVMEWARESKNDLLQLVCGYHSIPLPPRGSQIIFRPLEHLQAFEYQRPPISALGLCEKYLDIEMKNCNKVTQVKLKLAAAEEAASLSLWTTATICRVLSLESILALVTGVLLEKQVVVLCPNLGVLSALVLSIIPIIRPFEWQSLFLPILPGKMLDFLDAPVPFIVGIQHKIGDLKKEISNLVRVNAIKNQVKTCYLPLLPRRKELISELGPFYSLLSRESSISQKHPVHKCNEVQANAAAQFLLVMRQYMESLCADFRSHTITSVQSNDDRVSILLKDSFIDSFPDEDQSFIELFVETQLFTVLSDSRLSSFENEYPH